MRRLLAATFCATIILSVGGCGNGAAPGDDAAADAGELTSYRAAADYSRARNGFAVLVQENGQIVFEDYQVENGVVAAPEIPHRLASGTKSFWGVAACAAVSDGILQLDENVSATLTEWKADPLKNQITVRQLLTLTSGLEQGGVALQGASVGDKYGYAVNQLQMRYAPGEQFDYGPGPYEAFGAFLARKLADSNESPLDYLRRRILDPIGLHVARWTMDGAGNPNMAAGAFLTTREWVKFGELVKNAGKWQGKRLVDADVLAESFMGTRANPAYGLTWWLNDVGYGVVQGAGVWYRVPSIPVLPTLIPDLIRAMGHGKQRLYVIPSRNLVIVRFGESEGMGWSDKEFLKLLLGNPRIHGPSARVPGFRDVARNRTNRATEATAPQARTRVS